MRPHPEIYIIERVAIRNQSTVYGIRNLTRIYRLVSHYSYLLAYARVAKIVAVSFLGKMKLSTLSYEYEHRRYLN